MQYLDSPGNNDLLTGQFSRCAICLQVIPNLKDVITNDKTTEEIKLEISLFRLFNIDLSEVNEIICYRTFFCPECLVRNQNIMALFELIDSLQENLGKMKSAVETKFRSNFHLDSSKLTDDGYGNSFFRRKISESLELSDQTILPDDLNENAAEYPEPIDIPNNLPEDENMLMKMNMKKFWDDVSESESENRFFLEPEVKMFTAEEIGFDLPDTHDDGSYSNLQDDRPTNVIHTSPPNGIQTENPTLKIEVEDPFDEIAPSLPTLTEIMIKPSSGIKSLPGLLYPNLKIPTGLKLKDCRVQIETLDPQILNNIPINISRIPHLFSRPENSYGQPAPTRTKTRRFTCEFPNCSTRCSTRSLLRIHRNKFHSSAKLRFHCQHCGMKFRQQDQLKNHVRVKHMGQFSFVCPVCNRGFISLLWNLKRHLERHGWEKDAIDEHVDNLSKMRRQTQSPIKYTAESSENYQANPIKIEGTHNSAITDGFAGPVRVNLSYKCQQCEKMFRTRPQLNNHVLAKHPISIEDSIPDLPTRFEAPQENPADVETATGTTDRVATNGQRIFNCDYPDCPRKMGFFDETELELHVKQVHQGIARPYECDECGQTFKQRRSLTIHMKTQHLGEYPALCSICGKGFRDASDLRNHMNTHTNETPYKCSDCDRSFKSASYRAVHMRFAHTGERPFRCDRCGKAFVRGSMLTKHVKCVHNRHDRPFVCHLCGNKFPILGYLRMHMIRAHKKRGEVVD